MNTETPLRSWAKSASWRIVGIVLLGGISYALTRNWEQATVITAVFHTLRFVLYYYHERWWARVAWGTNTHPLSHLPVKRDLTAEDYAAVEKLLRDRNCIESSDFEI
ncbi:MAG: DUF2061 domain-containing protein [Planctomycetes bacterium]|nr:DUF2061 domain-containing protein [Planctomycetota bacterium]